MGAHLDIQFVVPKGEILMASYWDGGECHHIITTKPTREFYYLYKVSGNKLAKVGKASTPVELEDKYMKGVV